MKWKIHQKHKVYGEVVMVGNIGGESYRWFENSTGTISMIPLSVLEANTEV